MATDNASEKSLEAAQNSGPSTLRGDVSDTAAQEARNQQPSSSPLTHTIPQGSGPKPSIDEVIRDPYEHLSEQEAQVLRRQVLTPEVKTGFAALYRYCDGRDKLILFVSAFAAVAAGAALPMMTVIFGNLQSTFQSYIYGYGTVTEAEFRRELNRLVIYFIYLAVGEFFASYISTVGFLCKYPFPYFQACLFAGADHSSQGRASTSAPKSANVTWKAA